MRQALLVLVLLAHGAAVAGAGEPPEGSRANEPYPASFRLRVAETIDRAAARLLETQRVDGRWGNRKDPHAMGHTALPLLALLKAGVDPESEPVQRAFLVLETMGATSTYGAGCYAMALHARYVLGEDMWEASLGKPLAAPDPRTVRARMSGADRASMERVAAFLLRAQAANGLWRYHEQAPGSSDHDLSTTQYALLGLRAAAACGVDVPLRVWRAALDGLFVLQEQEGPKVDLLEWRIEERYALRRRIRAEARGFRYRHEMRDGPQGKGTVPVHRVTGSMTTAGIACLQICDEALQRSRRQWPERRRIAVAMRDAFAWLQENFSVEENPGAGMSHHHYYLYGLERGAMLAERRWIGDRDWYREGADVLLAEDAGGKGFGGHEPTSFAILFLKRATTRLQVTGK